MPRTDGRRRENRSSPDGGGRCRVHGVHETDDAVRHYGRVLEILQEARGLEAGRLPGVQERLADLFALKGNRAGAIG